jgi:hypothetical protein
MTVYTYHAYLLGASLSPSLAINRSNVRFWPIAVLPGPLQPTLSERPLSGLELSGAVTQRLTFVSRETNYTSADNAPFDSPHAVKQAVQPHRRSRPHRGCSTRKTGVSCRVSRCR